LRQTLTQTPQSQD